jgi:hypothetical protein
MNDFSFNYSNFIYHVKNAFQNNTLLENILNETNEQQLNRIKKFNDSLNSVTLFNYFLKNKLKLFSHKEKDTLLVSESIFGAEIPLKKLFNNQDESVKLLFWMDLKCLLLSYNNYVLSVDPTNKNASERVQLLSNLQTDVDSQQIINPKEGLNKILKTENLNSTTNNMINDIFETFEKNVSQPGSNPFANIMQISQIISEKYKSNIENGEVNLDDLLSNMTELPGMESMSGLIGSLSKQMQGNGNQTDEKIIIDENFSTAIVQQGEQPEESQNIDIGGLLKTMDSLGALGNPLMNDESSDENSMSKLINVFGKLSNTSDPSQLNQIIENDLGIDMNKFTNEMSKVLETND